MAQTNGNLEGSVRDISNLPIQGAAITVTEALTGTKRLLVTDSQGRYAASSLAPGSYDLEVHYPGFRSEIRKGVDLAPGRTLAADFVLTLGETRDSIVVAAQVPPISPAPGDWSGFIEQEKIESLPLDGRDLFDLASVQPGARRSTAGFKSMNTGLGTGFTVNGSRPNQNSFRVDGIFINDPSVNAPSSAAGRLLGLESVQELQLLSNPFDVELGRTSGGSLVAISKSGSNELHGSAYEFLRDSAMDAKNFFDQAGQPIPSLERNQFGGLLSGPLRKNRLFFMTNYEAILLHSGQTDASVVPNADSRQGRLPGGVTVPVSPLIVPYLNLYPLSNGRDFGDGTAQFLAQHTTVSRENYLTGKVDAVPFSRFRFSSRYTFDTARSTRPDPLSIFTYLDQSHYHFLHNEIQFTQTANTIHSLRAGFSRQWYTQDDTQPASIPASLSFVPGQPMGYIAMTSGLTGIGGATGDSVALMPRLFASNDFQFNYLVTHIRGAHSLRFGASFDRVQFNERVDRNAKGSYTFSSLTSLLQAQPSTGSMMMPGSDSIRGWRQDLFSAFAQDEIRLTPRFRVELGVRYETYSTPSEVNGKVATLRDILHDTAFSVGGPLFDNPSRLNFAPRASVAFLPFGSEKTVIRAGAGIFYDQIGTLELVEAGVRVPPFFNLISVSQPSFPNLPAAVAQGAPGNSLDMLDYYLPQPHTFQGQFMAQQEVARDTVLQAGYVRMRGIHLPGQITEDNPVRPQILADGELLFPASGPRLNPAFGPTRIRRTQFDASYNALQLGFERTRGPVHFQIKYAWSKGLDDTSNAVNKDFLNSDGTPTMFNYKLERGRSDFDVEFTFGANFSWSLPSVRGGVGSRILSGWELHGLIQAQTGLPFSPTVGFDRARIGYGSTTDGGQRPVFVGVPGGRLILGDPSQWFNPLAFALPTAGMYGNLGRNVLDGPGLIDSDLALHKALWNADRRKATLRIEVFNIANHPNFQIPSSLGLFSSNLSRVGSAGQITTTTTSSRQIQLGLRFMF
jgi:hypothetical protein